MSKKNRLNINEFVNGLRKKRRPILLSKQQEEIRTLNQAAGEGLKYIQKKWPRLYNAMEYHRTTHDEVLTFSDRPWLMDIYKDNSRNLLIMKCAQVGISEMAISYVFTFARQGLRGLYVLPDDNKVGKFVQDRIDSHQTNVKYKDAFGKKSKKEADSTSIKIIYGRTWRFAGAMNRKNFFEFQADVRIIDEYDLCVLYGNLPYSRDRILGSKNPHNIIFGNPEIMDGGIHREFLRSTANEWHVECDKCKAWQVLEWRKHFVRETGDREWELRFPDGSPECEHCHKPFNRLGNGLWIPKNPDSKVSGYHVTRLFADVREDIDGVNLITSLFQEFMDAQGDAVELERFFNTAIGEPYKSEESGLDEQALDKVAIAPSINIITPSGDSSRLITTVAGVDQGADFHYVIAKIENKKKYVLQFGTVYKWSTLREILHNYNVSTCVVDAQGGGYAEVRDFVQSYDGGWMCYYRPKDQVKGPYDLDWGTNVVVTNRTESLDNLVGEIRKENFLIPKNYKIISSGQYLKQMIKPRRVIDVRGLAVWTKGEDHYFHASGYCNLAARINGQYTTTTSRTMNWRARRTRV